jgi:hypothetical protein
MRLRLGAAVVVVVAAVVGGGAGASAASAPGARFVYESCDAALPGGNPPPYTFKNPNGGAMGAVQTCAAPGGALGIVETGDAQGDPSWLEVGVLETPGGFVEAETITAMGSGWAEGNLPSHVHDDGFPPGNGQEWAATFHERDRHELFFGSGGTFTIALDCNYGQAAAPVRRSTPTTSPPPRSTRRRRPWRGSRVRRSRAASCAATRRSAPKPPTSAAG